MLPLVNDIVFSTASCYYKKKAPMKSVNDVEGAKKMRPEDQQALKKWISGNIVSAPKKHKQMPVDTWDTTVLEGDYVCKYADAVETCHQ
jgi:hypothetical protein